MTIKAIIFDFDGVILESTEIKTEAFRNLFAKWGDKIDHIVYYHKKNMGVSRYIKFKHIYEDILKMPYSEEIGEKLGKEFSKLVLEKIKNAPFVSGALEFLKHNYNKYDLFIASGTPENELQDIVSFRGLNLYFKSIFGTPSTKSEIIKRIMKTYCFLPNEVVFIGDADTDKKAAEAERILFILRKSPETEIDNVAYKIENLFELQDVLERIEKCK